MQSESAAADVAQSHRMQYRHVILRATHRCLCAVELEGAAGQEGQPAVNVQHMLVENRKREQNYFFQCHLESPKDLLHRASQPPVNVQRAHTAVRRCLLKSMKKQVYRTSCVV